MKPVLVEAFKEFKRVIDRAYLEAPWRIALKGDFLRVAGYIAMWILSYMLVYIKLYLGEQYILGKDNVLG